MSDREVCVCYFVEVLDLPQPTISRHLAYLRHSGLVSSRRQCKWMHYRIVLPSNLMVRGLLMNTLRGLASDKEMLRDRLRLKRACCTPEKFVRLEGAPAPTTVAELAR
jgi:ArsR family transcriptional regulator